MFTGALVGVAGASFTYVLRMPNTWRTAIAAIGLASLAAREYGFVRFRLPDLGLIVPAQLVAVERRKAATIWGSVLGVGFLTLVKYGVFYGLQFAIFALAEPKLGGLLGLTYGLARSFPGAMVGSVPAASSKWARVNASQLLGCGPQVARLGGIIMVFCSIACIYATVAGLH